MNPDGNLKKKSLQRNVREKESDETRTEPNPDDKQRNRRRGNSQQEATTQTQKQRPAPEQEHEPVCSVMSGFDRLSVNASPPDRRINSPQQTQRGFRQEADASRQVNARLRHQRVTTGHGGSQRVTAGHRGSRRVTARKTSGQMFAVS